MMVALLKYGLNMFLIPIKLGTFNYSSYLILIGFFSPYKRKLLLILVPSKTTRFV